MMKKQHVIILTFLLLWLVITICDGLSELQAEALVCPACEVTYQKLNFIGNVPPVK